MKKTRILSAVLTSLLLLSVLIACGEDGSSKPVGDTAAPVPGADAVEEVTTEDEGEPDLPEKDFGGDTFNWLVCGETNAYVEKHIIVEEMDGEVVNDAVYERNRAAEEKFNCKITATFQEQATTHAENQ